MNSNRKIEEYNIVRVIAVILVVISHATYYQIITEYGGIDYSLPANLLNINSMDEITLKVLNFFKSLLYTFHMPVFFALSGALFKNSLNNRRINNYKELIIKKSKRLLIPFVLVIFLYSTPIKYLSGYFIDSKNILKDILLGQVLLQGNNYLWFLPTLFFEFLIIWIVKDKINDKKKKIIFLISFAIINVFGNLIKINLISNILLYLIYFYIGYCFEEYRNEFNKEIDKNSRMNNLAKVIFIVSILIIFNLYYSISEGLLFKIIKYPLKLIMGVLGIYMVYLISYKLSKTTIVTNGVIKKINKCSFGIYLYSDPLNYLILYITYNIFGIHTFYTNPGIILIFFARISITFIVALNITSFIKKKNIKYIC